jgi:hypothetical protein
MLKLIVMRVHGQVMVLFSTAYIRLTTCLLRIAKHLLAHTIQIYRSVQTLLLRLVQIQWNFKVWAVNQTIAAQSIKQGLSTAKAKVIQIGSQLLTTVLQTLQYASLNQLQNKGFVVKMKLAQLRLKGSSYALIRIVRQWIQVGLKLLGIASQHRLVAYLLQQLEKVRVALTKKALLIFKKPIAVLTRMGHLLKGRGWKYQEPANLHRPRAKQRRSKGS